MSGDGAIDLGPSLEALARAVERALSVPFMSVGDKWPATTRATATTAGPGAAERSHALEAQADTVDGNDAEAVGDVAGGAGGAGPRYAGIGQPARTDVPSGRRNRRRPGGLPPRGGSARASTPTIRSPAIAESPLAAGMPEGDPGAIAVQAADEMQAALAAAAVRPFSHEDTASTDGLAAAEGVPMATMSCGGAALAALLDAMDVDPTIRCVGEDLGRGGVFGRPEGPRERFGRARVPGAPTSDGGDRGRGVRRLDGRHPPRGRDAHRRRPFLATGEPVDQIAKARFMFGGQRRAPKVIRKPRGM